MKVYLVFQRIMKIDYDETAIVKIFDSEEKAKQYIEATFKSYDYSSLSETWMYKGVHDVTEVWFEEWEVQ